jgi:hypothetical protein
MRRAMRALLTTVAAVMFLVVTAQASADNPGREPIPLPEPFTLPAGQYCSGFDVLVTYTRMNEYVTTIDNPDGSTTIYVTGNAAATVQNTTTGKTLSFNISGPGTETFYSDGSLTANVGGPNLFYTTQTNSYPGVPPIIYTTGHVTFSVAASGITTSFHNSGHLTDVCAALA